MSDVTVDQVLDLAADKLDEYGWCQGRIMDPEGRMCAGGAMGAALQELTGRGASVGVAREEQCSVVLNRYLLTHSDRTAKIWSHFVHWNDDSDQDRDNVTDTLRRAAKWYREGYR